MAHHICKYTQIGFILHCISIMLHSFVGDYRPVIVKKFSLIELCCLENTQSEHDYFL